MTGNFVITPTLPYPVSLLLEGDPSPWDRGPDGREWFSRGASVTVLDFIIIIIVVGETVGDRA